MAGSRTRNHKSDTLTSNHYTTEASVRLHHTIRYLQQSSWKLLQNLAGIYGGGIKGSQSLCPHLRDEWLSVCLSLSLLELNICVMTFNGFFQCHPVLQYASSRTRKVVFRSHYDYLFTYLLTYFVRAMQGTLKATHWPPTPRQFYRHTKADPEGHLRGACSPWPKPMAGVTNLVDRPIRIKIIE